MKVCSLTVLAFVAAITAVGCAAPAQDQVSAEGSAEALTLAECATQRDRCLRSNPILGLLTCPAQYVQCTVTADNGLPAQVTAAISDVRDCTDELASCTRRARGNAGKLAVCAEDQAQCVAAIVGADLPNVVGDTVECVDGAVDCVNAAKRVSDLAACGDTLEDCALDVVQSVLPPEVADVVGDITVCTRNNTACINAAETAADLTQCAEDQAQCVANSLNVTLPNVPLSEVVSCAEHAARCGLDASSIADVRDCATDLTACAADVVESVDVPPQLTCEQTWTACLTKNPLNFLKCAADLAGCQD